VAAHATAAVLLELLLLLLLVQGILQHIGTDRAGNGSTGSAEESSAGLVSSPGRAAAAN
jgi:hypothetical protein